MNSWKRRHKTRKQLFVENVAKLRTADKIIASVEHEHLGVVISVFQLFAL